MRISLEEITKDVRVGRREVLYYVSLWRSSLKITDVHVAMDQLRRMTERQIGSNADT